MRNAIVFINICIVAGITMLLVDFESYQSNGSKAHAVGATLAAAPKQDGNAGTSLIANRRSDGALSKRLSEKEAKFVSDFITEMAQVRIMDREQSKLAVQRGTSRALKDFGAWLVINQQQMLTDLNKIADKHDMKIPTVLSESLTRDLSEIEQMHGKRFDSRYIKSLTAEFKRDLKRLERASYSQDAEVQVFATRYISITKDNLAKLQQIRLGR